MKLLHTPLCIAISGQSGCGNTSVSSILAESLSIAFINYTFRSVAKEKNMTLAEVCEQARKDSWWDKYVDEKQRELSRGISCVVGSRLAIWMLDHATIKIYLYACEKVRAHRIQKREGGTFETQLAETHARDESDRERYNKLYGIDILYYTDVADAIINTEEKCPQTIVLEIVQILVNRKLMHAQE